MNIDFDVVCDNQGHYSNGPHAHSYDMLFVPLDGIFSVSSPRQARGDVLASGSLWFVPERHIHHVSATPGQRHLCYYLNIDNLMPQVNADLRSPIRQSEKWGTSLLLSDLLRVRAHLARKSGPLLGPYELDLLILQEAGRIMTAVLPSRSREPADIVREVRIHIGEHLDGDLSCATLARQFGTSERTLSRWFHAEQGQSIGQYVLDTRLAEAKRLLFSTTLPVVEIQNTVGFASAPHFAYAMRKAFGLSPRHLRRRGAAERQEIDSPDLPST
ncbi:two component AraC family transcriptional regulator [Burkholderia lata]|uniref:Two component AraC family transcriptional regulator n=1 Tax=Burkholderia lata (strain ATCC 17760 / DSM 23089 / LMG 22485 / NCIMB 9086 / R18194 / 383) TaxID=482957 RepID=A0A6P2TPC6_BURL3|nr:two component AraC family transcriptional regulator [Burkholderia lata]